MIIHPDGRLEGTPEELMLYQQKKTAEKKPYTSPTDATKSWWLEKPLVTLVPRTYGTCKLEQSMMNY